MRTRDFAVMGIHVRVETASDEVMQVAQSSFGVWDGVLQHPEFMEDVRVLVRVAVTPDDGDVPRSDFEYRIDGHRLHIRSGDSVGTADAHARTVHATVQGSLVRDADHFRYGFLEALTLYVVTHYDRQPFHAAAVALGDTALLLAGPPGIGKSTLAYACMRAGLRVLTDDHVNLEMEPRLRIWGMSSFLHLRPEAHAHFNGLPATGTLRANGATKLSVAVPRENGSPPFVEHAGLCLLARGTGEGGLQRLDPDEAVHAALAAVEPGFDRFAESIVAPLRLIANTGSWRLVLNGTPQDAVPHIQRQLQILSGV